MATTGQAASEPDSNVTPVARGHVLVVEDDPDLRELLQIILRDAGHTVALAADGDQALEFAAARPPDAVVLDLILPGTNGWEVASRLHNAAGRRIPVIVATAASPSLFTLPPEVACVLPKPFEPAELVTAVDAVLRAAGATIG